MKTRKLCVLGGVFAACLAVSVPDIVDQRFYPSAGPAFSLSGAQITGRVNSGATIIVR